MADSIWSWWGGEALTSKPGISPFIWMWVCPDTGRALEPDPSRDKAVCFNAGISDPCVISESTWAPTYHLFGGPLVFSGQNLKLIFFCQKHAMTVLQGQRHAVSCTVRTLLFSSVIIGNIVHVKWNFLYSGGNLAGHWSELHSSAWGTAQKILVFYCHL